ncbi:MAG: 8-oxo-dGTP diphosphatase [Kiritimatiellae bacterium]|nr:8-oxo-dGTP diphosphatase [Kiritimatiellia bacterium]
MKETTLCYLERDDAYLMLYRNKKKHDPNAGKWIGIGGKLEAGETPDACLLREVYEETGLTLTAYTYRGVVNFQSDQYDNERMHVYTATGWDGVLHPCDEGELRWIPKAELFTYPMWEGDALFLRALYRDEPFFRLTLTYRGDTLISSSLSPSTP